MTKEIGLHNQNGQIRLYIAEAPPPAMGTLVCVHGGPGGDHRGNDGIFDDIAKYCGSFRYNIVQFDMFGAGKSDGGPADITLKTQLRDYETALEFATQNLAKPIHVIGESMGATIAALDWKDNVATYVLLWPAFDLKDTDLRPYLSEPWLEVLSKNGYLEDNGMIIGRDFLQEVAHHDFSSCFCLPKSPCLLVHGKRDMAVPFQQSLDAVKQSKGESVLFAHPAGDHGLQRPDEREFTRTAIKWWLSRFVR